MLGNSLMTLLILLSFQVFALAQQRSLTDLNSYEWENRLLLIFTPGENDTAYESQLKILKGEEAGLKDRDLKIFHLPDDGSAAIDDKPVPKAEVQRLAEKYDIDPGAFAVILIGKDCTEKLRQNKPLKTEKLFSVIDAMPMRQREMHDNRQ